MPFVEDTIISTMHRKAILFSVIYNCMGIFVQFYWTFSCNNHSFWLYGIVYTYTTHM